MHSFHDEEFDLKSRHHLTDCPCCIVFILSISSFCSLFGWAYQNGELGKLSHGMDSSGQVCGVSTAVVNMPYLYWCAKAPTASSIASGGVSVDMEKTVCVSSCPGASGSSAEPACSSGATTYTTKALKNFCIPDGTLYPGASSKVVKSYVVDGVSKVLDGAAAIPRAWPVLVASFFAAMVFGYTFLFLLKHFAEPLIWLSMLLTIVGLGWLGIYLWQYSETMSEGKPAGYTDDDVTITRVVSVSCWVVAFLMMCLACCFRHSIESASAVIEVTCEVIFDMPSLLFAPVVKAIFKTLVAVVLLYGFLMLLSSTDQKSGGEGLDGFNFTKEERTRLITYMFMSFWILAFLNALYQFSIAYAVTEWYYTPFDRGEKHVGHCGVFDGFFTGLLYHSGSLAMGSFLIAIFMTVQKLLEYAQHKNEENGDNEIVKCILCCCICCVHCCKDTVEFMNKNAYIDMAITSDGFCAAAKNAMEAMTKIGGAMAILTGATHVFEVFGVALITMGCGFFSYVVTGRGTFSDPQSSNYIDDPKAVMAVSMIIGCIVSLSFMNIFAMGSDTLLFCYGYDINSGKGGDTAPDALKALVHGNEFGGRSKK